MDPLILRTLRFYGLCPDQLLPNFYQVMSCVSRLNHLYSLHLDYHDINYMYSLCGNIKSAYYLKVRDVRVRLISCLPDSNRNLAREFIQVSSNWHANELTCLTSPRDVGWYRAHLTFFLTYIAIYLFLLSFKHILTIFVYLNSEGKIFKSNIRVVYVRDLNFVLRSKIFFNSDGQLRASHLILGCTTVYTNYQPFG